MALGGIPMTSAAELAALHSPFEDGPLAEIVQLLELLAELGKTLLPGT